MSTDTKQQHTQGEWFLSQNTPARMIYVQNEDKVITSISYKDEFANCNKEEAEANAKLIAAAPELLEALKEALKEMRLIDNIYPDRVVLRISQAEAAIKKATE